MSVGSTLKFIINHPLNNKSKIRALIRLIKWQISVRINPYPIIYPFAEKSRLIIWKGLTGATSSIYCGLQEFEDMGFVLHFLRKEDMFIDIGANIGSYTLLSASEVGAETVSFEPIPQTFKVLKTNIVLNDLEVNTRALNIGLGSQKGMLKFTASLDTVNHVATLKDTNTIDVQIERFDGVISNLHKPTLIKIDVEGFESEVIDGMRNTLVDPNLKGIIIELNGSGKRYGYNEEHIHDKLLSYNFKPFQYSPFERRLIKLEKFGTHGKPYNSDNIIYIRDIGLAQERLTSAKKFKILEQEV
jgi:FkbM family methyltransferase